MISVLHAIRPCPRLANIGLGIMVKEEWILAEYQGWNLAAVQNELLHFPCLDKIGLGYSLLTASPVVPHISEQFPYLRHMLEPSEDMFGTCGCINRVILKNSRQDL